MSFPKGIAKDFSGIVLSAGADSGFQPGDEVFGLFMSSTHGTLAEAAVIDTSSKAGEAVVLKKPASWSWNEAASLPLVISTTVVLPLVLLLPLLLYHSCHAYRPLLWPPRRHSCPDP